MPFSANYNLPLQIWQGRNKIFQKEFITWLKMFFHCKFGFNFDICILSFYSLTNYFMQKNQQKEANSA